MLTKEEKIIETCHNLYTTSTHQKNVNVKEMETVGLISRGKPVFFEVKYNK